jgi:hypothetical protein
MFERVGYCRKSKKMITGSVLYQTEIEELGINGKKIREQKRIIRKQYRKAKCAKSRGRIKEIAKVREQQRTIGKDGKDF